MYAMHNGGQWIYEIALEFVWKPNMGHFIFTKWSPPLEDHFGKIVAWYNKAWLCSKAPKIPFCWPKSSYQTSSSCLATYFCGCLSIDDNILLAILHKLSPTKLSNPSKRTPAVKTQQKANLDNDYDMWTGTRSTFFLDISLQTLVANDFCLK